MYIHTIWQPGFKTEDQPEARARVGVNREKHHFEVGTGEGAGQKRYPNMDGVTENHEEFVGLFHHVSPTKSKLGVGLTS